MSQNIETARTYLDGFRKNDHKKILSCLTDDIEWTVFGAFHLIGKEAYDRPSTVHLRSSTLQSCRSFARSSRTMSSWQNSPARSSAPRGGEMRMSMAEVFVRRGGKSAERCAWVIVLHERQNTKAIGAQSSRSLTPIKPRSRLSRI